MFGKRKFVVILGVLAVLVIFSTVSAASPEVEENIHQEEITVTDARGVEVTFETAPERIISFMPSNTEILFHLEVGDRVVGVDSTSDYPSEVEDLPEVGDSFEVDYEKIIDLEPDVVVTPSYNMEMIETLENEHNETVVATSSTTLEDVYSDMDLLGEMCGIEDRATEKINDLKSEMDEITKQTRDLPEEERVDVFYMTSVDPIYTPGNNTFQNTLIEKAGGRNIAEGESGWWEISEETIVDKDPEVIIGTNRIKEAVEKQTEKEAWQEITAVENDEIHFVNDDIVSRPGPRVVQGQGNLTEIIGDVAEGEKGEESPGFTVGGLLLGSVSTALLAKKVKK